MIIGHVRGQELRISTPYGGDRMTLVEKAKAYNRELRDALQLIYDELNPGQRKKIMRNTTIKALYERYGIGGNDE